MNNLEFYDIIDTEIEKIKNKLEDEEVKKKSAEGKKAYCFLLWFLQNNLYRTDDELKGYTQYIVDGNDDNSCDLIFPNKEDGETVYYVVQAKWFAKQNINKSNDLTNIYKACLTDFNMILRHRKEESKTNKKFNTMYRKLKKHVENNGKVRFLLVTLCVSNPDFRIKELDEYCSSPLVKTEIYDIVSIKNTYIDSKYRGYVTDNPLQGVDAVNQNVDIRISQGYIRAKDNTYIFLIGAQEINRLYSVFGHRLFLKNVRNPLSVKVNKAIEKCAQVDPSNFLGYNNGITVITKKIYPFYDDNLKITIDGMQVINGAQTFKSISDAYQSASNSQKKKMRDGLTIVMKVIAVESSDIERKIIQYTNTQTSIVPRDYRSNDKAQEKLYIELLRNTDIIYERKRGEFTEAAKKELNIVSNENMAQCYLAYGLQKPQIAKTAKKQIFDSESGIYEQIFDGDIDYRLFYIAYIIYHYASDEIDKLINIDESYKKLKDGKHYITALMKHTYRDYDPYFDKEYNSAVSKKKNVDRDKMAVSIEYNLLVNSQDKKTVLETSYKEAIAIVLEYLQKENVSDTSAFYKRAESYEKILSWYEMRRSTEKTCG